MVAQTWHWAVGVSGWGLLSGLKTAFDGIADAGVVVNDGGMVQMPPRVVLDMTTWPHVIVEVNPL